MCSSQVNFSHFFLSNLLKNQHEPITGRLRAGAHPRRRGGCLWETPPAAAQQLRRADNGRARGSGGRNGGLPVTRDHADVDGIAIPILVPQKRELTLCYTMCWFLYTSLVFWWKLLITIWDHFWVWSGSIVLADDVSFLLACFCDDQWYNAIFNGLVLMR